METQENQPKKDEKEKPDVDQSPDESKNDKKRHLPEMLKNLPCLEDRVGQSFVVIRCTGQPPRG